MSGRSRDMTHTLLLWRLNNKTVFSNKYVNVSLLDLIMRNFSFYNVHKKLPMVNKREQRMSCNEIVLTS